MSIWWQFPSNFVKSLGTCFRRMQMPKMAHSADRWADGLDSPYRHDPPQFPSSVDGLTPCRTDMSRAFEDTSPVLLFLPSKTTYVNPLTPDLWLWHAGFEKCPKLPTFSSSRDINSVDYFLNRFATTADLCCWTAGQHAFQLEVFLVREAYRLVVYILCTQRNTGLSVRCSCGSTASSAVGLHCTSSGKANGVQPNRCESFLMVCITWLDRHMQTAIYKVV